MFALLGNSSSHDWDCSWEQFGRIAGGGRINLVSLRYGNMRINQEQVELIREINELRKELNILKKTEGAAEGAADGGGATGPAAIAG